MQNKLSIIIPIFNEKKILKFFFNELFDVFKNYYVEYIIINDGSFDGTEVWLNDYIKPISGKKIDKIFLKKTNSFLLDYKEIFSGNKFSEILILNHSKNQGKGSSIIDGLKKSSGDYLLILDSDLEYDIRDSLNLYNIIQKGKTGEVIFGNRFSNELPHRHGYILNLVVNHINTFIFNILFNSGISDINCGLKIFSRNVYDKINLTSKDFSIDMDIATQIVKKGFLISEVGVSYYSRTYKEGKKISWIDGLLAYWYLLKFRFTK